MAGPCWPAWRGGAGDCAGAAGWQSGRRAGNHHWLAQNSRTWAAGFCARSSERPRRARPACARCAVYRLGRCQSHHRDLAHQHHRRFQLVESFARAVGHVTPAWRQHALLHDHRVSVLLVLAGRHASACDVAAVYAAGAGAGAANAGPPGGAKLHHGLARLGRPGAHGYCARQPVPDQQLGSANLRAAVPRRVIAAVCAFGRTTRAG